MLFIKPIYFYLFFLSGLWPVGCSPAMGPPWGPGADGDQWDIVILLVIPRHYQYPTMYISIYIHIYIDIFIYISIQICIYIYTYPMILCYHIRFPSRTRLQFTMENCPFSSMMYRLSAFFSHSSVMLVSWMLFVPQFVLPFPQFPSGN